MAALVDGLDTPNESQGHFVGDVGLFVFLKAKVSFVDQIVFLKDMRGFEQLELFFIRQFQLGVVKDGHDRAHDQTA